jgi:hypothetical protein
LFEFGCQLVFYCINNPEKDNSQLGAIFKVCIGLLPPSPNFADTFVRRQANNVVHNLAKATILTDDSFEAIFIDVHLNNHLT